MVQLLKSKEHCPWGVYEKRPDIHAAFLSLGCALICWHFLRVDWGSDLKAGYNLNVRLVDPSEPR
jgi:hypothetical protein